MDWLLPPHCVACRRPWSDWFCDDCRADLATIQEPICPRCGSPLPQSGALCRFCLRYPLPSTLTCIRSVATYRSGLGRAIRTLKYGLARDVAAPLGALLAEWLAKESPVDLLLMPVPLHEDKRRERGFNQSELLCHEISRQTGLALDSDSLVRARKTRAQVGLDAGERYANVHGAFAASARLDGRAVLLIDDVCTTGATLGECSLALSAAGAGPIWALTLAREA